MNNKFQIEKYHFKTESIFDSLSERDTTLLKKNIQIKEEKGGKNIFREGAYSKGVYILKKGTVKIYQINNDGKEQIVYIYSKGEMMGYRPLLCKEKHPVTAATLEECTLYFIPATQFIKVLDRSPALARKLLENLSYEFMVWTNKISTFAQQPVLGRVATSLLILNEKYKREKQVGPVVINLSREDIASYVGTTIESLVRMLRYLKDEKVISSHGRKITILDTQSLVRIANLS